MVKIHLPLYAPAKPNAPPPPSHRTLKTTMPEHAPILPVIAAEVAALAPGFRALSLTVEAAPIVRPEIAGRAMERACQALARGEPDWAEAHLAAWAEAFRRFGAKPQRTPCSAEALRKRALRDGGLPSIDPVVDLYNAISVQFAIPIGGENLAAYAGPPRLVVADGSETFDTLKNGEALDESPTPARWSGATTSASPAAAGTGARACAPAWMPAPGACGSSSRACRKCRWRPCTKRAACCSTNCT